MALTPLPAALTAALEVRVGVPTGTHADAIAQAGGTALDYLEHLTAVAAADLVDDRRGLEAVLMLAHRLWVRRDSPAGASQGFEGVPVYVAGTDPDLDALVVSLRQTWGLA